MNWFVWSIRATPGCQRRTQCVTYCSAKNISLCSTVESFIQGKRPKKWVFCVNFQTLITARILKLGYWDFSIILFHGQICLKTYGFIRFCTVESFINVWKFPFFCPFFKVRISHTTDIANISTPSCSKLKELSIDVYINAQWKVLVVENIKNINF